MRARRRWAITFVLLVPLAIWVGCDYLTERSLLVRAVRWMDADMGDIKRFPQRTIAKAGSGSVFAFHQSTAGRYDTLFAPVTLDRDGVSIVEEFAKFLETRGTYSLVVIRRDTLLYERNFGGRDRRTVETTFSVSKSLVSVGVGLAVDRGWIGSIEDPITKYLPELAERDSRFESLTLKHLMTMTGGVRFTRGKMPWGDEARSYYHPDLRSVALSRDMDTQPGTRFQYNFYNPILVGLALERASGRSLTQLLSESVWRRIGAIEPASWSLDSRRHGFEKMESGFNAAPIDLAKLGRLFLKEGDWNGDRVLSADWIRESVATDSSGGRSSNYGYFWWLSTPEGESTRYFAEGRFGQFIYVVPQLELIMVRTGGHDGNINWPSFFEMIVSRVNAVAAGA